MENYLIIERDGTIRQVTIVRDRFDWYTRGQVRDGVATVIRSNDEGLFDRLVCKEVDDDLTFMWETI